MILKWYGHASFRITASDGTSIITDPYTPETCGYDPIIEPADLVLISSATDTFHCRADLIPGEHAVVNALELARNGGSCVERGIPIRAVQSMEAYSHRDFHPDDNGMYRFEVDGIHIGHMGDMGNPLSAAQMAFFEGVDVLLALAGGYPTIELPDLKAVIDHVQPKLVVPMHFRTLRWRPQSQHWIAAFLDLFDPANVDFAIATQVTLTREGLTGETLPPSTRALVLAHAC